VASHWRALELCEPVATRTQQVHLAVPAPPRPRPRAALPGGHCDPAAEGGLGAVYWRAQEAPRKTLATVGNILWALRERAVTTGIRP
jgi:hypothetical protein